MAPAPGVSTLHRGGHFGRLIQAHCARPDNPFAFAAATWGEDSTVARMIMDMETRSAVPSLNSADDSALVPSPQEQEFVSRILERSVLGQLVGLRTVPFLTNIISTISGADAYWLAEGEAVGVSSMSITGAEILPKKVGNISVISEQLARYSSPRALVVIERDATIGLANAITGALLDVGNAGSAVKPQAITYNIAVQETLSDLMASFQGDPNRAVWIGSPALWLSLQSDVNPNLGIAGGTFGGTPAISSRYAPDNGVAVLVDPNGISLATGALEVSASRQATVLLDSQPNMDVGGGGSPVTPTPAQVVGLWQCNAVGLKLGQFINWKTESGAVAMISFGGSPGSP